MYNGRLKELAITLDFVHIIRDTQKAKKKSGTTEFSNFRFLHQGVFVARSVGP